MLSLTSLSQCIPSSSVHDPVQRRNVECPLANMVCRCDHDHALWLGNLFCNTNKAQVAFLGITGKTRGCRNRLAPLERVALLLWGAVGGVWSCHPLTSEHLQHVQVALPTHMKINAVVKKFLFVSAGLWISWHEALQRPVVIFIASPVVAWGNLPFCLEAGKADGSCGLLCTSRCVLSLLHHA